jgi:hypothetical protein
MGFQSWHATIKAVTMMMKRRAEDMISAPTLEFHRQPVGFHCRALNAVLPMGKNPNDIWDSMSPI